MSAQGKVGDTIDEAVWRPPTHGASKLLWYMTLEEFEQLQQGELSLQELQRRVTRRDDGQHTLTDFGGVEQ